MASEFFMQLNPEVAHGDLHRRTVTYVRPARDYIRLDEVKDVIMWKDDGILDINGWDLRKAMIQFARGNATLFEWSISPVVYKATDDWASIPMPWYWNLR